MMRDIRLVCPGFTYFQYELIGFVGEVQLALATEVERSVIESRGSFCRNNIIPIMSLFPNNVRRVGIYA